MHITSTQIPLFLFPSKEKEKKTLLLQKIGRKMRTMDVIDPTEERTKKHKQKTKTPGKETRWNRGADASYKIESRTDL
jgi:hypothetical protein